MSGSAKGLIKVMFDKAADLGERDDAARDLRLYPHDDSVLLALEKMGSDPDETEEFFVGACGESIGEILVERNEYKREFIENLVPVAKMEAVGFINARKPEWIKQYNLEEFLE